MPMYTYRCTSCRHVFDALQGVSAPEKKPECPVCGTSSLERVFSTFSFINNCSPSFGGG